MNMLALYIHTAGVGGIIATLLVVGLVIWLIFYVLPLPPMIRTILAVVVAIVLILLLLPGCGTNTGNPSKDKAGAVTNAVLQDVFNQVLDAGLGVGASALEGQNGQDAAEAAFLAAGEHAGVDALGTILTAYAGPQIAPVATAATNALTGANPQTPADKVAVLNTIGAAIQTAADEQFSK